MPASASLTRSAVNGTRRTDAGGVEEALPNAAATGTVDASPPPHSVLGALDQDHLDRGIGEAQDGIARPVDARHPRLVELHFLVQRPAQALHNPALNLVAQRVGIDDQAAVVGADDALDVDAAGRALHRDLDERREVVLRHLVAE